MQVKIIKDSIKKYESLAEVQRQLLRRGVEISYVALHNALTGETKTLRFDVLSELVEMTYEGDWNKAGRGIKEDLKKEN